MKKTFYRLISVSLLSLFVIANAGQKACAQQDAAVSFQAFYDNLAPYGQWVNDPQYGNVWVPNEEGDFRPYGSRGHWVMTDYGNTWVSDEPWGWACYHYGRWTYESYYGWVWIPGYEWAPAWVSWRYGNGYCGWAPLGPVGTENYCPDNWWIFVGPQYMYRPDYYHYREGVEYNRNYIGQTTIITNNFEDRGTHVQYNYGPRQADIERDTHQRVQVYSIAPSGRPDAPAMSGQRLNIYRPAVDRSSVNEARPANVFQSTHPLGAPQGATTITSNRPPAFRQEVQQNQSQGNNRGGQRPGNNNFSQPQPAYRQPANYQQPVNRQQPEPQQQRNFQQPTNTQQPAQQQRNFQQPRQQQQQPVNNQRPAPQQRGATPPPPQREAPKEQPHEEGKR